jgi:hypothetical protein
MSLLLDCMNFATKNFSFDSLTIVDSDQLSIRSGFSKYLGSSLTAASNIGMLSNRPKRLTSADTNEYSGVARYPGFQRIRFMEAFFTEFFRWRR